MFNGLRASGRELEVLKRGSVAVFGKMWEDRWQDGDIVWREETIITFLIKHSSFMRINFSLLGIDVSSHNVIYHTFIDVLLLHICHSTNLTF